MSTVQLRPARDTEAGLLSELALRSKGHLAGEPPDGSLLLEYQVT